MAKYQIVGAIAATVLFTLAAESGASSCSPAWKFLSEGRALSVDSGAYTVKFSAILVGCEASLDTLKEAEIHQMQEALKRLLGERSLDLIGTTDSKKLRIEAVAAMNRALGRKAVTDVYFCGLAVGEAM